jgi:hypothetical protein
LLILLDLVFWVCKYDGGHSPHYIELGPL